VAAAGKIAKIELVKRSRYNHMNHTSGTCIDESTFKY
jgi:hypothetical protein